MATHKQLAANRRNAQKSTGPRSAEGKSVSRFNALKSGIHAESHVIPSENAGDLEALTAEYQNEYQPANPSERCLVDTLIAADWQLRRLRRVEAQLWQHEFDRVAESQFFALNQNAPLGDVFTRSRDSFTLLQRRLDAADRSFHRALRELQRLRNAGQPTLPPAEPTEGKPTSEDLASFSPFPPNAPLQPDAPPLPPPSGPQGRAAPHFRRRLRECGGLSGY